MRSPGDTRPDATGAPATIVGVDAVARVAAPVVGALRVPWIAVGVGIVLAAGAAVAAPANDLLPRPEGAAGTALAVVVLGSAFAAGYLRPLAGLYGLVVLVVLEGAIRKWAINDIVVFLAKDFLALGIYAGVLPRLTREHIRRPWWLVTPLAGLLLLALVGALRVDSFSQAAIGLRSYAIYVPLFWVAPALLTMRRHAYALAGTILGLAALNGAFAVVQALAGPGTLNKLVSGALAGLITVNGVAYIRPSGSFMQVGVLAIFLFFGTVVAFGIIVAERRGHWRTAALVAFALISWGVVYSSARSSLGSLILAFILLAVVLVVRRRFAALLLVPAVFVVSLAVLFTAVPWIKAQAVDTIHAIEHHSWKWVTIPRPAPEAPLRLRVPPDVARDLPERLRTATKQIDLSGIDADGNEIVVGISPHGGPVSTGRPVKTVLGVNNEGQAVQLTVGQPGAGTAGGFLGRAADFNTAGGEVGVWESRIRPQFSSIGRQGPFGNGTGTMTLGSGYADDKPTLLYGEGTYVKLAWELGWIGLGLFVWLLVALGVATVRGVRRARDWKLVPALVGAAAALILPIWYVFTFAVDFPVEAILFWAFAGCAAAYGSSAAMREPIASHDR